MLGVKSEVKQEAKNCKKRKCNVNMDSMTFQRKLHEYLNQKINFGFTMKLPEIIQTSTFIIKELKTLT